ncbi:nucleotidyltransferase [Candidatus Saganbacteria bacterium]|nr:nucleotidyltransferase [Candidatus Saganbacteria bacterium]
MNWIFEWFQNRRIYYEDILRKLNEKKINYLLVGGLAVSMYKVPPRFTMDIDLIVEFAPENVSKFIKVLLELGYKPKVPVDPSDFADPKKREQWIKEKNMKVFAFTHPDRDYELVDVFVDYPMDYKAMESEKKVINVKGMKIFVPSKKHLIALKKMAGRPEDLVDIKNLEALPDDEEEIRE